MSGLEELFLEDLFDCGCLDNRTFAIIRKDTISIGSKFPRNRIQDVVLGFINSEDSPFSKVNLRSTIIDKDMSVEVFESMIGGFICESYVHWILNVSQCIAAFNYLRKNWTKRRFRG